MFDLLNYSTLRWVHSYDRVCMYFVQAYLIEGSEGNNHTVQLTGTVRYTISGRQQADAAVLHD